MNDHYFTGAPASASDLRSHEVSALGLTLTFDTDAGVFSKEGLDEGSALLLASLPPLAGRALDLGCGWGAIGVMLARRYPELSVVMSDVNERAVALAAANAARNGATNAAALLSDGFDAVTGTFDAIVTNPPIRAGKRVIYALFAEAMNRLNPGGALYIVIRKQQGAPSAQAYLETLGETVRLDRSKGYWVLQCSKGRCV